MEAEQAVLGGILLRNSVLHSVVDTLRPEDFYLPAHQQIYDAILRGTDGPGAGIVHLPADPALLDRLDHLFACETPDADA